MEKYFLKMKILKSAIQKHQDVLNEYRKKIQRLNKIHTDPSGENSDSSPEAHSEKLLRVLKEHLLFINEEMNVLYNIENTISLNHEAKPGSVVVTNKGIFFISAFIDSFLTEGKKISCVSENSPFYFQVRGKKNGEKFQYEDSVYDIIDIY